MTQRITYNPLIADIILCDSNLSISFWWLAVMLFNQMSNSEGLRYTANLWSSGSSEWNLCVHTNKHTETRRSLSTHPERFCQAVWVFQSIILSQLTNVIFSSPCVCVCVYVLQCEWKRKEEKVITSCLVYVLVIYSLSAVYIPENVLTFQKLPCHFRNNWPCAEQTSRPVVFFFFFFLHAPKLPQLTLSLSFTADGVSTFPCQQQ